MLQTRLYEIKKKKKKKHNPSKGPKKTEAVLFPILFGLGTVKNQLASILRFSNKKECVQWVHLQFSVDNKAPHTTCNVIYFPRLPLCDSQWSGSQR